VASARVGASVPAAAPRAASGITAVSATGGGGSATRVPWLDATIVGTGVPDRGVGVARTAGSIAVRGRVVDSVAAETSTATMAPANTTVAITLSRV